MGVQHKATLRHAKAWSPESAKPRAQRAIGQPLPVDELDALEAQGAQPRPQERWVRPPPVGRVAVQPVGGVVGKRRASHVEKVTVRLDDEGAGGDRCRALQYRPGVRQVVEHPEQEDEVEAADALGAEVEQVRVEILDRRAERNASEVESPLGPPAVRTPCRLAPARGIDRDHPRGAAALGLEGEEPVPGADVQDGPAVEVLREMQPAQLAWRIVLSRRNDAVSEVQTVEPTEASDPGAELVGSRQG